ncbi:ATP-binding protein [Cellulophaga sp. L1A9]|uniref:hybrid sensor histidine kinase/response regulator n=1 Tax=Cellulophaga sp. L1A9 TaxID=2686362 RepID=UPI00131B5329|nr:ATP-binding protein [Cellulophaga sp. L1A9]
MKKTKSKNKFTFRIVLSYLILVGLAVISGIFILSEIKSYLATDTSGENDVKLIKTGSLLTQLYEAESLSKLALQNKTKENFTAYAKKIDVVSAEIDSLKEVINNDYQVKLLDSVQNLLKLKTYNNEELRRLKLKSEANSSLDVALAKFNTMELSLGKITPKSIAPNIDELSPKAKSVIEKLTVILNDNAPKENHSPEKIDSIINASRSLLNEAKEKDALTQRALAQKEREINKNDLDLSQQLRSIISAFEQEIIATTRTDNSKKQEILKRSTRLASVAAILAFLTVGIFTFLITRDYWRVQTYRQNLEEEKKFSESLLKSREQLISTVSHDLRTPLNTITGYSELMENTGLSGKQVGYLKNVKSAAKYVDNLVNDLLDFSKLEAGKLKIVNIPFLLPDLIQETAQNLEELYKNKPIELQVVIDKKLHQTLIGDPFRIRQILTNLISNAYKFTQEGFIKVVATVTIENTSLYKTRIQVIDSGIGIEKEKQEHIFKEFTQADDSTEKKYGGYGLGLTISKKLTELLQGTINLKSDKNQGSTFTFTIPLKLSDTQIAATEKKEINFKENKITLLIIDDDIAMRKLLQEVCENSNIKTISYADFNAIGTKEKISYNAVLTDIQMPTINGFEVLKKLKSGAYQHYTNQPVLAMTGRTDLETSAYIAAGFTTILQKPFAKDQFLERLAHLFPEITTQEDTQHTASFESHSTLFSLKTITSFLDDSNDGLKDLIDTFLRDTVDNLEILSKAVATKDSASLNATSHKMLAMFRQLEVNDSIAILETFENLKADDLSDKELKAKYQQLKNNITALTLALKANKTINPDYTD